jgi:alkanesulfonate monooxygenase SsuD/methylene tetrahydromethanopterin reductase-like flavin-dependent oxidoreductase (luciferase family)
MRSGEVLDKGGWLREFDQLSDLEAGRRAIPSDLAAEVAVVGDSAAVRKRLARYQALGVTHVFAPLPQGNAVEYKALLGDINPNPGIF